MVRLMPVVSNKITHGALLLRRPIIFLQKEGNIFLLKNYITYSRKEAGSLNLEAFLKQGVLIVRVEGELDAHNASEFRQKFDEALDQFNTRVVIINFSDVNFIDSSGLGVILGRYRRITILQGKILAVCTKPQIAKIFELSGILKIIELFSSEREALAAL
jgi:stage II sporulation protein AA (anti-sigma F factor antagonist)